MKRGMLGSMILVSCFMAVFVMIFTQSKIEVTKQVFQNYDSTVFVEQPYLYSLSMLKDTDCSDRTFYELFMQATEESTKDVCDKDSTIKLDDLLEVQHDFFEDYFGNYYALVLEDRHGQVIMVVPSSKSAKIFGSSSKYYVCSRMPIPNSNNTVSQLVLMKEEDI